METNNQLVKKMEQEYSGRKCGILIAAAVSVLVLLCSLPVLNWILVNAPETVSVLGLKESAEIASGYTVYNFLGFVGESGKGSLGMAAMLILI